MERSGRYTAITIAFASICAIALLGFWIGAWQMQPLKLILSLVLYAAVFFPLVWLAGRQYDIVKHQSITDGLTGVYNRFFIENACLKLFLSAKKTGKRISISIIDVNDFKLINDTHGHLIGDQVLKQIAKAILESAGKGEIVARFGGDEFIVLCPYADKESSGELQNAINHALEQLSLRNGVHLSLSIGTAVFPEDGQTLHALMESADRNMYAQKQPVNNRATDKKPIGNIS